MTTQRLRSLVVEDEWPARNYLVELLEASRVAEVVGAVASAGEARQALASSSPLAVDVAFVDVELRGDGPRAGLELLRQVAPGKPATSFVLTTARDEHAVEAFELGVVDYLLKPFTEERVANCLERLRGRRIESAPQPTRIVARRKANLVFLDPSEIYAFEASDRLTFVHTKHGRFDLDLSLAAIESSLGRALLRTHRRWLVNAKYIKELVRDGGDVRVFVGATLSEPDSGVQVPVSRDRATQVRELLLENATGVRR
ncbi:LytTR family transcriptional regulator DNA-binding domain-containing protein [soil metagenome]